MKFKKYCETKVKKSLKSIGAAVTDGNDAPVILSLFLKEKKLT